MGVLRVSSIGVLSFLSLGSLASAQPSAPPTKKPTTITKWLDQPDDWFKSDEGQRIIANILSWQMPIGAWHKTYDTLSPKPDVVPIEDHGLAPPGDRGDTWAKVGTIDNDATYSELRVLARAIRVTGDDKARAAFDKGLAWLLSSQYPNGGFPQRFPLQNNYGRHITYNDDAMINVILLLRDIAAGQGDFTFVTPDQKAKCAEAEKKADECILATQIVVDGKPTVWGQQHDEVTLKPAGARTFELPSFCSTESARITQYLMDKPNPDARTKAAIEGAVAWFESHKIPGRYVNRAFIKDDSGPLVWARFYDLEEGKPLFVDRDSSRHRSETELGNERRLGYAWYSTRPAAILKAYPAWKAKHNQ